MEAAAVTDLDWFRQLRTVQPRRPVNFWTPTGWHPEKLAPGERLFFMLKAPIRRIGGFGRYRGFSRLTLEAAWDEYGQRNGVRSLDELVERTERYASTRSTSWAGPDGHEIGCIELDSCAFWSDDSFATPDELGFAFPNQVVTFKYVDIDDSRLSGDHAAETAYARELASAQVGDARIERLMIRATATEEIRFSWWPEGRLAERPLDLTEDHLLELFERGIEADVLSPEFQLRLLRLLLRDG